MKVIQLTYYASTRYEGHSERKLLFSTIEKAKEHFKKEKKAFLIDCQYRDQILIYIESIELDTNKTEMIEHLYKSYSKYEIEGMEQNLERTKQYHPDADHSEMEEFIKMMKENLHEWED